MDLLAFILAISAEGITDEQVQTALNAYIAEHPEAVTTVTDGSITKVKLDSNLQATVDDVGVLKSALPKAINRYVTPQDFGAKGDGETDDTDAIQDAIDHSTANGGGVYFPPGTYLVTETLSFYDVNYIEMDSKAVLKAGAAVDYVVEIRVTAYPQQRPLIRNIRIDGDDTAVSGVYLRAISNPGCVCVAGLIVENCTSHGIVFENCQGGLFEAIKSSDNGGDGIQIIGCNNAKFISLTAISNGGDGIVFNKSQGEAASGAVYAFGTHAEQNTGVGLHFVATGLTSLYSGWLEGNTGIPIVIDNDSKCLITGFRIVWGGQNVPWADIDSDYATIRDIEIQGGNGATYAPAVKGTSIVENIQSAYQRDFDLYNAKIAEKLLQNVIPNGDMQGGQSAGAFSVFYCGTSKEYQNTDVVDTGKTYSLKAVSEAGAFSIRKDGVTGWTVGTLYKITFRVYLNGDDCKMRVAAADQTLSKTVYGQITDVKGGRWNDVIGYFYPQTNGEIRISCGMAGGQDTFTSAGAIFYVSELFCQPCVEKRKISNKLLGGDWLYTTIEPPIMT